MKLYSYLYLYCFQPEKQILFVIQALQEITGLFDDAVVPWDAKKFDDFLNIVHSQIDGLRSCVSPVRLYLHICVTSSSAVEPEELILFFLNAGRLQNEEEQKAASLFWKIETNDRAEQGELLLLI